MVARSEYRVTLVSCGGTTEFVGALRDSRLVSYSPACDPVEAVLPEMEPVLRLHFNHLFLDGLHLLRHTLNEILALFATATTSHCRVQPQKVREVQA